MALPNQVDRWWRERARMTIVGEDGRWRIEGQGHERAKLAYAYVNGGRVAYTFDPSSAEKPLVSSAVKS